MKTFLNLWWTFVATCWGILTFFAFVQHGQKIRAVLEGKDFSDFEIIVASGFVLFVTVLGIVFEHFFNNEENQE